MPESASKAVFFNWVLAVAIAVIATPTVASDWVKIGVDKDGRSWLVDKSSITRDGSLVRAWKRVEFSQPSPYPPTGQLVSVATFLEFTDCKRMATGVKESKLFSTDGSTIAFHVDPDEKIQWQSASPGSFLETAMRFVCEPIPAVQPEAQ